VRRGYTPTLSLPRVSFDLFERLAAGQRHDLVRSGIVLSQLRWRPFPYSMCAAMREVGLEAPIFEGVSKSIGRVGFAPFREEERHAA
jgi:hypothetical protein